MIIEENGFILFLFREVLLSIQDDVLIIHFHYMLFLISCLILILYLQIDEGSIERYEHRRLKLCSLALAFGFLTCRCQIRSCWNLFLNGIMRVTC